MQDLASLLSNTTELSLTPRITLKSGIIKELSKRNTLFILRTKVGNNNNMPSNNKAPAS
jgi:hypothetical protein